MRLHRWLIWVFLTTTLALVGLTAFDLVRLALEARATVDSVGDVRWHVDSAIADADALRDGGDTLESAAARLSEIERRLDRYGPALAVASIVPPLRRRIEETQALLAIHVDLSSAGAMSLDVAAGLLDRLTGTGESRDEPLPALVETLKTERESIRGQLALVERASARLDTLVSAPGGHVGDPHTKALRDSIEALHAALRAALLAPQALGSPTPKRYLLLAQKSDELRPTGGFIGNIAFVTLADGEARDLTYLRSYLVENPTRPRVPPPPPFRRYQGMRDWNLRDANWHPDFRASADEIQRFLALNGIAPVDGMLAFDQQALGILLAAIGPIEIPGHAVRISSANAYTVLEHYAHSTGDRRAWFSARPFYAELTSALLSAITDRLRSDPQAVIGALQAMVGEKHLMAAFKDPAAQDLVDGVGAGGRLPAVPDDLLYVVDAQIDHGAPFRSTEQTVHYHANPKTGRATLTIDYVNVNSPADANGRLADYLRVYVPAGTRLISVSGLTGAQPARQVNGLTEFSGFLDLPPGGQRQVQFRYWLPPLLAARWSASSYALHVSKQPGTDGHRLTVETPQGVVFDGRLTTDLVIREPGS